MFNNEEIYTPKEIAFKMSVSEAFVQRLCKRGDLQSTDISKGKKRATYRCLGKWVNTYFGLIQPSKQQEVAESISKDYETFV